MLEGDLYTMLPKGDHKISCNVLRFNDKKALKPPDWPRKSKINESMEERVMGNPKRSPRRSQREETSPLMES